LDEVRVSSVTRSTNWVWAEFMNMASNGVFNVADPVLTAPTPGFDMITPQSVAGVGTNSAVFTGNLLSTGATATAVFLHYGLTDGGTSTGAWTTALAWPAPVAPGAFVTNVTGLTSNRVYYYRFSASNVAGRVWTPATGVFMTSPVWFSPTNGTVQEGGAPVSIAVVRALTATNIAVTVNLAAGGTATPGVDYTTLPATVTIPAGTDRVSVAVTPLIDNAFNEADETVSLTVAPGLYPVVSLSNAVVTITEYHRYSDY
jgi:hypothetical protein